MHNVSHIQNADTRLCSVELPNVQGSDTTDDDSSNVAGQKKLNQIEVSH